MSRDQMSLAGFEKWRYFAPTIICAYLALLCLGLLVTAGFLVQMRDTRMLAAAAVYGLLCSGGVGLVLWRAQRRELRFVTVPTETPAAQHYAAVRTAMLEAGWTLRREQPGGRLDAQTPGTFLADGERVVVEFADYAVRIASIADPSVGFSLAARRHCAAHRDMLRRVVLAGQPPMEL